MAGVDVALRITRRKVSTAVRTFTHPGTGRTVTLVGTIHIGDLRYFRRLSLLVKALAAEGAEIHVEGISRRDDDRVNDWELGWLDEASTWPDLETTGAAATLLRTVATSPTAPP